MSFTWAPELEQEATPISNIYDSRIQIYIPRLESNHSKAFQEGYNCIRNGKSSNFNAFSKCIARGSKREECKGEAYAQMSAYIQNQNIPNTSNPVYSKKAMVDTNSCGKVQIEKVLETVSKQAVLLDNLYVSYVSLVNLNDNFVYFGFSLRLIVNYLSKCRPRNA